jgi:hypothetical protein
MTRKCGPPLGVRTPFRIWGGGSAEGRKIYPFFETRNPLDIPRSHEKNLRTLGRIMRVTDTVVIHGGAKFAPVVSSCQQEIRDPDTSRLSWNIEEFR